MYDESVLTCLFFFSFLAGLDQEHRGTSRLPQRCLSTTSHNAYVPPGDRRKTGLLRLRCGSCHWYFTVTAAGTHLRLAHEFHCLRLRDLQRLNEGHAGRAAVLSTNAERTTVSKWPEAPKKISLSRPPISRALSTCPLGRVKPKDHLPASGYHVWRAARPFVKGLLVAQIFDKF